MLQQALPVCWQIQKINLHWSGNELWREFLPTRIVVAGGGAGMRLNRANRDEHARKYATGSGRTSGKRSSSATRASRA